jgi:hypothetical protein
MTLVFSSFVCVIFWRGTWCGTDLICCTPAARRGTRSGDIMVTEGERCERGQLGFDLGTC